MKRSELIALVYQAREEYTNQIANIFNNQQSVRETLIDGHSDGVRNAVRLLQVAGAFQVEED